MKTPVASTYSPILVVDTTDRDQICLALIQANKPTKKTKIAERAQSLPEHLEKFLAQAEFPQAIALLRQPGSLTGVRVGMSAINTLAWLNNVLIIEIDQGDFETAISQIKKKPSQFKVVAQTTPIS